jgi:hypothetical protein
MSALIDAVIDRIKGLWVSDKKADIEGYLIMNDGTKNKSLLLVKDGEKSWKTKWFNNNENTYKAPTIPLTEIFVKQ